MAKPTETLDDFFEAEAQASREQAIKEEGDAVLQAQMKAKRDREAAKIASGATAYTAEEIAAHEAEEAAEEDSENVD